MDDIIIGPAAFKLVERVLGANNENLVDVLKEVAANTACCMSRI